MFRPSCAAIQTGGLKGCLSVSQTAQCSRFQLFGGLNNYPSKGCPFLSNQQSLYRRGQCYEECQPGNAFCPPPSDAPSLQQQNHMLPSPPLRSEPLRDH